MPRRRADTPDPIRPFAQISFRPNGWMTDITVACDEDGNVYWPVRALCVWLGVLVAGQLKKLRNHRKISQNMRYYLLKTSGGEQPTWTILERQIARWFITIDDPRVREELADKLEEFQDEVVDYAYERLFGHKRSLPSLDSRQMTQEVRRLSADVSGMKLSFAHLEERLGHVEEQLALPPAADPPEPEDDEPEQ